MASFRPGFKLSYVDFPPRCAGAGGVVCSPNFERFDALVNRANEWLRRNGHLKACSCESIEIKGRLDGIVDTNKSSYFEADHTRRKMRNIYIRALRLWIVPKEEQDGPEPQKIGYVNIVPSRNQHGIFDSFGDTIRKFNEHVRHRPLPGLILNVESQEMKFHDWGVGVDPDESCWVESVKFNLSFLVCIRIFYEVGLSAFEEIGCADFVPTCTDYGSQLGGPAQFESFSELLARASGWTRYQHNVRITNVQSIDYKLPSESDGSQLDTQRSFYVESGRQTTRYLRILRLCFVRSFSDDSPPCCRTLDLSYATFEPVMLSRGGIIGIPLYESMTETMKRAMRWLNTTNPHLRIISAETVPVRVFSGNQHGNHEVTYTWNRSEQKEIWLLVIRLFFDGEILEPPPDCVSPALLKTMRKEGDRPCCTIS